MSDELRVSENNFENVSNQELLTVSEIIPIEEHIFSSNEIEGSLRLARTLKKIHLRLVSEGFVIERGKIYKANDSSK